MSSRIQTPIDLSKARQHLIYGDAKAIAGQFNISPGHLSKILNGTVHRPDVALAVMQKAEERKKEAEEIERLQKTL